MSDNWLARTEALLGDDIIKKLASSRIAIIGLGGVGAAAAEGICRSGVGNILMVDSDNVSISNLNRQLIATVQTVGQSKSEVLKSRLLSINPQGNFVAVREFLLPENLNFIFDYSPDIIIDAIDTVTTKLALASLAQEKGIPIFMSMGTGGRLDPTLLRSGDIEDTAGCSCSLARVLRRELKRRGISHIPVVYSLEVPSKAVVESDVAGRHPPSSSPFVPPCAGFALASMAVRKIAK